MTGTPISSKPHTPPSGSEKVPLSPDGYATTQEIADLGGGGGGSFPDYTGSGSPEGVITADTGESYVDTTNGALYWFSGADGDNTGWIGGSLIPGPPNVAGFFWDGFDGYTAVVGSIGAPSSLTDINALGGTDNRLVFQSGFANEDGLQNLKLQLGSTGQFSWAWAADGSTSLPGTITGTDSPFLVQGPSAGTAILTTPDAVAGTTNGIYFNPGAAADGLQRVLIELGSTGQFEWGFERTGLTTLPGPISTAPTDSHTATTAFGALTVGTPLQNTFGYDILVTCRIPVTAAVTGSSVSMGVGPTATPTVDPITGNLTAATTVDFTAYVPAGYYLSVTSTGTITLGTPTLVATPA